MLLNRREPIALHWPVIELAPVSGRPMLPVSSARSISACAVRTASCPWFTPIVHQNETRFPLAGIVAAVPWKTCATLGRLSVTYSHPRWIVSARRRIASGAIRLGNTGRSRAASAR